MTTVGIDLGTTNSLIGTVIDGHATLFESHGTALFPSVVSRGARGEVLTGRPARNHALLAPDATLRSVKRHMGTSAKLSFGGESLSPTEASALILTGLLDLAERAHGARPTRAVITVPAYFGDAQREATKDAGEIAGLEVARLVNEPTAAALTHQTGTEELVMVYDLGGGTFDVSILERDAGFMEVRASHGDTQLGGDDVDAALVEWLLARVGDVAPKIRRDRAALERLREAAERTKVALSKDTEARCFEPYLVGQGAEAFNLDVLVRRADLDALVEPLVDRTLRSVDEALAAAKLKADALDRILLVGGASLMPLVSLRLAEHLDMPVQLTEKPQHAVGLGAAILAGRLDGADIDEILVDITPFTLAAGVIDGSDASGDLVASPVIPRGTVVPTTRSRSYSTTHTDQPAVEVPITQGESPRAMENVQLGTVFVEDLPPSPAGSPVDVTFQLDLSGVLRVSATHRLSGMSAKATIRRGPTGLSAQQRRRGQERVQAMRDQGRSELLEADEDGLPDPETADDADTRLLESLVQRAERVRDTVSGVERERLDAALERARGALRGEGSSASAADALVDVLYDLE